MSRSRIAFAVVAAGALVGSAAVADPVAAAPAKSRGAAPAVPASRRPASPARPGKPGKPGKPVDWTAELLTRADQVAVEVARVRGLSLVQPIQRDVVDVAELRRRLAARAAREKTAGELAAEEAAAKRWGMVPAATRYADLLVDVLTEQIAGYYDPEDKRLYIARRDDSADTWADMLLAHEIDHALQDQHFDLEKWMDLPPAEGDALLARQALVEGDGVVLMVELMLARQHMPAPWGAPGASEMMERAMEASAGTDQLAKAPLLVRESLMFPYRAGLSFVAELRRRRPWSQIDAAFASPPQSTEQILHPEAYLNREAPMVVTAQVPPALSGFRTVHEAVWGEQGVAVFLRQHGVSRGDAESAAAGWGGDRALLVAPPGAGWPRSTAILDTVWDTEIDALEAAAALTSAVDDLVVGAAVDRTPGAARWVSLDGREALVQRRGDQVVVVIGAPLGTSAALIDQVMSWPVRRPAP